MDSENTHNNLFLSKQAHRKPHALFCYFYNVKDCKDKFYYRIQSCILQFPQIWIFEINQPEKQHT